MKLSCNQEKLINGINIVNKIISTRASLPVLNNILLATHQGRLKLSSTDLEIGINTWIGAKIIEEGSITVPARLLTEFVANNTDEKIDLSTKGDILNIISSKHQANIKGINTSEFPLIPEISNKEEISLETKKLQESIIHSVFACALDETRPVLTGVFFQAEKNTFKLAATDSYRLAEISISLEKKLSKNFQAIIPGRTMSEVSRIISLDFSPKVKVTFGENQVLFTLENTQIISRLIEGSFPDYTQIIPKDNKTKITLPVKNLSNSIKIASFFARESANNIKIKIAKSKKIQISAISPQVGDEVSEENLETFSGEEVEIAFNAKFVIDVLSNIPDDSVIMEVNGSASPVVLKPAKTKGYLYIIMPLRIEE